MNSTQPWALEAERCDRTSSFTLPAYKRNANSGLLSGTGTQREERGRTQRGQAQEAVRDLYPRPPLPQTTEVEGQMYVGRDVCPRDGHRWTGDIRSKGAGTQTTKGDENPPRGRYFVPMSV